MTNERQLLKELGYDDETLAEMTDEDCATELQEIPYNQ